MKILVTGGAGFIGGGPSNAVSVWAEFDPLLERLSGHKLHVRHEDWRRGDQLVYISNCAKASREMGWATQVDVSTGVQRLLQWTENHSSDFFTS